MINDEERATLLIAAKAADNRHLHEMEMWHDAQPTLEAVLAVWDRAIAAAVGGEVRNG